MKKTNKIFIIIGISVLFMISILFAGCYPSTPLDVVSELHSLCYNKPKDFNKVKKYFEEGSTTPAESRYNEIYNKLTNDIIISSTQTTGSDGIVYVEIILKNGWNAQPDRKAIMYKNTKARIYFSNVNGKWKIFNGIFPSYSEEGDYGYTIKNFN